MKYLLPILLFIATALAGPVQQNFRLRIVERDGSLGGTSTQYLALKNGAAVASSAEKSTIITASLSAEPHSLIQTTGGIPGYLMPTATSGVYDFRFGGIPKIAGVLYTEFTFIPFTCQGCHGEPDQILAYAPPKDGNRYTGEFRAWKVGSDWVVKFHTSAETPKKDTVGLNLTKEIKP